MSKTAPITASNRKALEEMISKSEGEMADILQRFMGNLGAYGFKGEVSLTLQVKVEEDLGDTQTTVQRTTTMPFSVLNRFDAEPRDDGRL